MLIKSQIMKADSTHQSKMAGKFRMQNNKMIFKTAVTYELLQYIKTHKSMESTTDSWVLLKRGIL